MPAISLAKKRNPITLLQAANLCVNFVTGAGMEASGSGSDLRVIVYESLEQMRASKIGVKPLQGFDVTR